MLSTQAIHAFFQQFGLETIEENVLLFMRLQSCLIYLAYLQVFEHSNTVSVSFDSRRTTSLSCFAAIDPCYTDSISKLRNEFANSSKRSAKSKKLLRPFAGRCKPEIDFPSHPSFARPGAACLIGSHDYEWGHQEFDYPVKKRQETKSNFWPDLEVFTHSYYDDPKTIDCVNLTNTPIHAEQQLQRIQQLSSFQQENTGHLDPSAAEFSQIGQQSHPHKAISIESLPFIFAKVHNTVSNASLSSKLLPGEIGQPSVRPPRNPTSLALLHGARVSRVTNSLGDPNISGTVPPAGGNAGVTPETQSSMINVTGVYLSPTGTPVSQTSAHVQGQAPLGNQPYFHLPANQGSANDAVQGSSCSPDTATFRTHISLTEIENVRQSEVGSSQTITMSTKRDSPSSSMIATPQKTVATSESVQVSSSGESTLPSSTLLNHENSRGHSLSRCQPSASSPPQNRLDVGDPHSTAGSQGNVPRVSTESSAMDPATVAPFTTQNPSRLSSFAGGASSSGLTNSANSTTSDRPYGSDIGSSSLLPLTSQQMSLHQDISVNRELDALPTLSQGTSSLTSSLDARSTATFDTTQTCAMTFIIDQSQCEAFSQGDPAVTELLRAQAAAKVKNAREQTQNQAQDESQKKKQQEQQRPPPAQPGPPRQIGHTTCDLAQCFPAPVTPGAIDIQRPETLHRSPGSTMTVPKALEISAPRSSAQTANQHQVTGMPENHLDHPQLELRVLPDENGYAPHGKVTVFRVNPATSEGTTGAQSAQNHRQEMPSQKRAQEAQVTQAQTQQLQAQQIQTPQLQGGTRGQAQNLHVQSNALAFNPQTIQLRYVQNPSTLQWIPVAPSSQWTVSHAQNHIMPQAIVPQSMAPQWTGSQAQAPVMSQWTGSHVQNLIMPQSMTSQSMPPPSIPPPPMTPQSMPPPQTMPPPSMTSQPMTPQPMPPQPMPPQPMTPQTMPPQTMPPPSMAPQSMAPQSMAPQAMTLQTMPPQTMPPPSMAPQSITPQSMAPQSMAPQSIIPQSMPPPSMPPQAMPPPSMAPQSMTPQAMTPQSMPPPSIPPPPMTPQSMPPPQTMPPPSMTSQPMTPQPMPPQPMTPQPMPPQPMTPQPMTPQSMASQWAGNQPQNLMVTQWPGGQTQTPVVSQNCMPHVQMNGRIPQGQVVNFAPSPLQRTNLPGNMVMHPNFGPSQIPRPIGSGQINNVGPAMATSQVLPGTGMVNRGVTRTISQRDDAGDDYQQGATKRHAGSEVSFITPVPPTPTNGQVMPVTGV